MVRTIKGCLAEIKRQDPNTEITEYAIRRIVKSGDVPYIKSGKKFLVNVEKLIEHFNGVAEAPETEVDDFEDEKFM